jgi:transposase
VEKVLVPELRKGDVVIMDNPPGHKGPKTRELVEAAGASLFYLPPYSPDFNPIENAFAKLKAPYAKRRSERSRAFRPPSANSSISSLQRNAKTSSPPQVTMQTDRTLLL